MATLIDKDLVRTRFNVPADIFGEGGDLSLAPVVASSVISHSAKLPRVERAGWPLTVTLRMSLLSAVVPRTTTRPITPQRMSDYRGGRQFVVELGDAAEIFLFVASAFFFLRYRQAERHVHVAMADFLVGRIAVCVAIDHGRQTP